MNGKIWTLSEYGNGSEFIFEVELLRSSHQDKVIFDGIRPEDINLLLVEGDAEIRKHFKSITDQFGIHTDEADNSQEAIALTETSYEKCKPYDIIFLDCHMPDMDGYEATRIIRSMDFARAKEIPIIAITANAFKEDIERCLACGMNDHLAKPIDEKIVIEKLELYHRRIN